MVEYVKTKTGTNRTRSERAVMDHAFDSIRDLELIHTRPEHFLRVLECGKVSTNNYLRRFHNVAADILVQSLQLNDLAFDGDCDCRSAVERTEFAKDIC